MKSIPSPCTKSSLILILILTKGVFSTVEIQHLYDTNKKIQNFHHSHEETYRNVYSENDFLKSMLARAIGSNKQAEEEREKISFESENKKSLLSESAFSSEILFEDTEQSHSASSFTWAQSESSDVGNDPYFNLDDEERIRREILSDDEDDETGEYEASGMSPNEVTGKSTNTTKPSNLTTINLNNPRGDGVKLSFSGELVNVVKISDEITASTAPEVVTTSKITTQLL